MLTSGGSNAISIGSQDLGSRQELGIKSRKSMSGCDDILEATLTCCSDKPSPPSRRFLVVVDLVGTVSPFSSFACSSDV